MAKDKQDQLPKDVPEATAAAEVDENIKYAVNAGKTVHHDGQFYVSGEHIEMSAKQAKYLLDNGFISETV